MVVVNLKPYIKGKMFALGCCSHGNRKISRQKRSLTYRTWPLEAPPNVHVVRGGNR